MEESNHLTEIPDSVSDETVSYSGIKSTLQEVAQDLDVAHREIEAYYKGTVVLSQSLKDLHHKAERNGNTELANTAHELEESAVAIITRTKE
ncbi:hypothetical protein PNQ92_09595 [Halobacterium salinarum]|uniref:hypothetical protein n=1 Tax=Halobacterium salinarum TaxID=2242 RepID=UPI002555DF49|nr:hypothetical protein [Halobacterium salinarum]MDL0125660.1 hypothetical protein [Halobacterium salinarum]